MDCYGTDDTYFRSNIWYWRPLWTLVCHIGSDVLNDEDKELGNFNDGHTIDAAKSLEIGKRFHRMLTSGEIQKLVDASEQMREEMPDLDCKYCEADGYRHDLGGNPFLCNACKGTRKVRPMETWYRLDVPLIQEFTEFLLHDGQGNEFEIS